MTAARPRTVGSKRRPAGIVTDLDGTLLRTDKSVSARTKDAVDAAEDAGLLFIIATGRPPRWIPPVLEQIGDRGAGDMLADWIWSLPEDQLTDEVGAAWEAQCLAQ